MLLSTLTFADRCTVPGWTNGSYQSFSDEHNQSIYEWIPIKQDGSLDSCKVYTKAGGNTSIDCDKYVFDHTDYWGTTLNMAVRN